MLKDNLFSLSRFIDFCRKDMVESWKTNLLRVVMMYGVLAVIFVWTGYFQYEYKQSTDPMVEISLYTFLWVGLVCGCIAASFNMEKMRSKTSRISMLMLPATPFEKFFFRWLLSTIVYIVAFLIAFKLADYTRVLVCSLIYPESTIIPAGLKYIFASGGEYALFPYVSCSQKGMFIVGYFFLQSCFILGSSIWPKNSLVKTFVAGLIVIILYSLIFTGIFKLILEKSSGTIPNDDPESTMEGLAYIIWTFYILLNWVLAYYRFKEAEIINRL